MKLFQKVILIILGLVIVGSVIFIIDAYSEYNYFLTLLIEPKRNIEYSEYVRNTYYYMYKTKLTTGLVTILVSFALMWVTSHAYKVDETN